MNIIGISALSVISALLAAFLRKSSPEFSLLLSLGAVGVLFIYVTVYASGLFFEINNILALSEASVPALKTVIKTVGIGYIATVSADICRDNGQSGLASTVEIAAKVMIILVSLPIISEIVLLCSELDG